MGMPSKLQVWTTRALLAWMIDAFTKKGLDSPRLMAELLVSHVIGCDRIRLYMDADRPASPLEREQLRDLVGRALKHEPVQYLVGEGWFFGLPFYVDKNTLIPRPATETIVEQVLLHARAEPGFGGKSGEGVRFADIGTGSGAIAVALLKNLPQSLGVATDISEAALAIAKKNAERHKVADRLELLQGDLVQPLAQHPAGTGRDLHYIVSNPPYIPDSEWNAPEMVDRNVRDFEPESALRGGPDGLTFLQPIVRDAPEQLRRGGLLILETAAATAKSVAELMRAHALIAPDSVRVVRDFEGYDRVVVGARTS